jgi:hypothetical protein
VTMVAVIASDATGPPRPVPAPSGAIPVRGPAEVNHGRRTRYRVAPTIGVCRYAPPRSGAATVVDHEESQ